MADLTFIHLIFYAFSAVAVCAGLMVITLRNPVHSVLALVLTFVAMAGNWMLLRAEFLSLILILVYVGAVMTLFLFVVMMLNIDKQVKNKGFVRYYPFAIILVLLMIGLLFVAEGPQYFGLQYVAAPKAEPTDYSNIQHLGEILFTDYAYPFEIAGVILLAAIIASITLAHRGPLRRRVQKTREQLTANPAERLRLVKMQSEPGFPRPGSIPGDESQNNKGP